MMPSQSLSKPSQVSGCGEHLQTFPLCPARGLQVQPATQSAALVHDVLHTFSPLLSDRQMPPGHIELVWQEAPVSSGGVGSHTPPWQV